MTVLNSTTISTPARKQNRGALNGSCAQLIIPAISAWFLKVRWNPFSGAAVDGALKGRAATLHLINRRRRTCNAERLLRHTCQFQAAPIRSLECWLRGLAASKRPADVLACFVQLQKIASSHVTDNSICVRRRGHKMDMHSDVVSNYVSMTWVTLR